MAYTSPFVLGDGQQTLSIQPLALFHAPGRTNPLLLQGRLFLVFYHYSYDYNLHSHSCTPIHKMELLFPLFHGFHRAPTLKELLLLFFNCPAFGGVDVRVWVQERVLFVI